ncbi:MAG: LOG family protein [Gemmataceae bacterium]|nr:LOG family protein [Gemmataceae bacterium]
MSDTAPTPDDGLVPLSDEKAALDLLSRSVLGLWETVNTLTRLRPTRRDRYRVTVFGSARVAPDHWVYAAVRDLAAELTRLGCDIVTGGGPGLMQAANEGVKLADPDGSRQKSVGIRVELPFEQDVNAFVTEAFEHKTFFTRLHHFVLVSDAFVVTPGGIGTVLETLMVWQLLQVRHLRDTPLILAGHFWDGLLDWAKRVMLDPAIPLVSPNDLTIPQVLPDGPAIVQAVRDHHARWLARQGRPA